ncbi:hypothetical protein SOVF_149420 [Spinacia oleracea]|nr:hypothetical protein SOVF_149420 [Spinacia oleracea]
MGNRVKLVAWQKHTAKGQLRVGYALIQTCADCLEIKGKVPW